VPAAREAPPPAWPLSCRPGGRCANCSSIDGTSSSGGRRQCARMVVALACCSSLAPLSSSRCTAGLASWCQQTCR
jgi:hypothetical protein